MPDILAPTAAILATAWRGRDLSIAAEQPEAILHLEGLRGASSLPMPAPRRCALMDGATALSIGPDTWLWIGRIPSPGALRQTFKAAIDVSGAWTQITVSGENAVALLRKGCALDLHPQYFAAGSCAVSGMAGMRVVLWKPDASASYGLLVSRSYAESFWDWLTEAAGEFQLDTTTEQK